MLRSVIRRLVAHPHDTDDIAQQALLVAYEKRSTYRGDAKASTWLCSIGTRLALDYLRGRKPWRKEAQLVSEQQAHASAEYRTEVAQAYAAPDFVFDVHEHIAYCFTCVARTLEPDQHAALLLRDVFELTNDEGAATLDMSESTFRHRVADARATMRAHFDDLCALVSKRGVCWQCKGLRELHEGDTRGPELPSLDGDGYRRRLQIVREADVDSGRTQAFHDLVWRRMAQTEEER